jgi:hypothetical protein
MPVTLIGGEPVLYTLLRDSAGTIDKLTPSQLVGAAADLRNAALVIKHAGHFQGALVDRHTGAVCAVGGVELATYKRLVQPIKGVWGTFVINDGGWDRLSDRDTYRCDNAIIVLADMIPNELCDLCAADREPWEKVTHWNDNHCVTPELAQNVMGLAADAAMRLAADKRSLLAGRLLAAI